MRPHRESAERHARQREKVVASLRGAKPVPQGRLRPGVVAYAQVPFADGSGWKSRPVVIVSTGGREVTVRPITTARQWKPGSNPTHVAVHDWERAGLSRPSAVSSRTVVLDRMAVTGLVGELSDGDRAAVLKAPARQPDVSGRTSSNRDSASSA